MALHPVVVSPHPIIPIRYRPEVWFGCVYSDSGYLYLVQMESFPSAPCLMLSGWYGHVVGFVFGWFYFIKIIIFMKSKDIGVGCLLSDMIKSGFVSGEVVSPVDLVTLE